MTFSSELTTKPRQNEVCPATDSLFPHESKLPKLLSVLKDCRGLHPEIGAQLGKIARLRRQQAEDPPLGRAVLDEQPRPLSLVHPPECPSRMFSRKPKMSLKPSWGEPRLDFQHACARCSGEAIHSGPLADLARKGYFCRFQATARSVTVPFPFSISTCPPLGIPSSSIASRGSVSRPRLSTGRGPRRGSLGIPAIRPR